MAPSNMLKQHPLQQSTTLPGAMAESNWHAHGSGGETGAARQCRHSTWSEQKGVGNRWTVVRLLDVLQCDPVWQTLCGWSWQEFWLHSR
mmetsp:Transcript_34629/g.79251  ORF Transcript_34629/g.79251 Transcript_34629/m.79251 type:complete len:89 (-) Transcript_34629:66-332(-)